MGDAGAVFILRRMFPTLAQLDPISPARRRLDSYAPQPGDLLAFSGSESLSLAIRFFSCSRYSHVGICCDALGETVLCESTTLSPLPCLITGERQDGVQFHPVREAIEAYAGHVWVCRVSPWWRLDESERRELSHFLLAFAGLPYDEGGAALAEVRELVNVSDRRAGRFFCSDLAAFALMRLRRLPLDNSKRYTPRSLVHELLRVGTHLAPERLK